MPEVNLFLIRAIPLHLYVTFSGLHYCFLFPSAESVKKKKKAHPPKGPPFCAVTLFKAAGYRKCSGMPFVSYSKHTFFLRLCMAFLQVLSWYCSANHFHRMVTLFVLIV